MLDLPHTREEYTQFALEYSECSSHDPFLDLCDTDLYQESQQVYQELFEWIKHTINCHDNLVHVTDTIFGHILEIANVCICHLYIAPDGTIDISTPQHEQQFHKQTIKLLQLAGKINA